ncbi:MAG: hypothetical protein LBP21_04055 [Synergistaceae bacterium]|jgi:hypothetical protein|nr:hypothetical protein [Synergistaceae bacterium]
MTDQENTRQENAVGGAVLEQRNSEFVPQYDVTSKERYVDSTSQKSEFDRVLDELGRISQETLSWDILRMTRKHFGDTEEHNARKFEAFMGAFIVNAALELYEKGFAEAAFAKLEQAKTILEAKRKLAQEVEAIRAKREEDVFDVAAMLGLGSE